MRRASIAILLIAVATGCSGEAGDPPPAESTAPSSTVTTIDLASLERFDSQELGFAISYPAGWTVAPSAEEGLVQFTAPPDPDHLTPNFNVVTGIVPGAVAAYYEGAAARLEQNLPNVEILEEVDIGVDGVPGHGVTVVSTEGGVAVGISQLIVLRAGRAWEVTFLADANELGELSPLVTRIFQSFEFLGR